LIEEITDLPAALTLNSGNPTPSDATDYSTQYFYDRGYNRLKQVIYNGDYSVENRYTKYGSLHTQIDVISGINLMQVTSWNYKGQETKRIFNNISAFASETDYYPSTGQVAEIRNRSSGNGIETLSYAYDIWGNIQTQELDRDNNLGDDQVTETFGYDKLHRLKTATIGTTSKSYFYDNLGNITSKSDFSNTYTYGNTFSQTLCNQPSSPGPNAVTGATLIDSNGSINYHYDPRGNRTIDCINGTDRAYYVYDYNNLLIESSSTITGGNQTLEFNYGADNQRYRKYDMANNEITLYANKDYEQIFKNGSLQQSKYYITSYLTITQDFSIGDTRINFMQKDRLGSTTQILDETGKVLHTKSFDAFGKPRKGDWSDQDGGLFQARLDFTDVDEFGNVVGSIDISKRGFTDHEHLDEMQLIHMNGRMYDYNNGRFLSVDPFIQNPTSTQSMNPYTYIFNNPLSGVDPTGYLVDIECQFGGNCGVGSDDIGDGPLGYDPSECLTCVQVGNGKGKDDGSSKKNNKILEGITGIEGMDTNRFIRDYGSDNKITFDNPSGATGIAEAIPELHGFTWLWNVMATEGFGNEIASFRNDRTNPFNGNIVSEREALDNRVIGLLTLGIGNKYKSSIRAADELVDLYRAVSPEELSSIITTRQFSLGDSGYVKQFGKVFDEILELASFLPDTAAIVKTKIPKKLLKELDQTPVDTSILKGGSVTVQPEKLDAFNKALKDIEHVF